MSSLGSTAARGRTPTRRSVQVGFVVLLLVWTAQLAFWIWDDWRYTQLMTERLAPALAVTGAGPEQIAALVAERAQRVNRYAWGNSP